MAGQRQLDAVAGGVGENFGMMREQDDGQRGIPALQRAIQVRKSGCQIVDAGEDERSAIGSDHAMGIVQDRNADPLEHRPDLADVGEPVSWLPYVAKVP